MALYFIALVPPIPLQEKIKSIKEEIAEKYHARHALKLPAHITLRIPFKKTEGEEKDLVTVLEKFVEQEISFEIDLFGFGSFPPRVLFVNVANQEPVIELHNRLQKTFEQYTGEIQERQNFHPHITLATRDLARDEFRKAWSELKIRHFEDSWHVDHLTLFKHNGKKWDVLKEFNLL